MGLLRLLLAFSVVLAHSHSFFGFLGMGGAAVPAFFIISGFYMSLILTTKYQGRERLWLFYSNRALRLYPMYWALLLIVVTLAQLQVGWWPLNQISVAAYNPLQLATDGTPPSLWAAIPNLFFFGADFLRVFIVDVPTAAMNLWPPGLAQDDVRRGAYQYLIAPPIWSLGVEVVFYAFAPFMVRLSVRRLFFLLLFFCAIQIAVDLKGGLGVAWYHLPSPYNLCYFATGMLVQRAWPQVAPYVTPFVRRMLVAYPFGLWALWQFVPLSIWTSALLWLIFALAVPSLFEATKASKADAALGAYSYPVYLCHFLFTWPMVPLGEWAGIAAFGLSFALSWVLIKSVDQPIEAWRQQRAARVQSALVPARALTRG